MFFRRGNNGVYESSKIAASARTRTSKTQMAMNFPLKSSMSFRPSCQSKSETRAMLLQRSNARASRAPETVVASEDKCSNALAPARLFALARARERAFIAIRSDSQTTRLDSELPNRRRDECLARWAAQPMLLRSVAHWPYASMVAIASGRSSARGKIFIALRFVLDLTRSQTSSSSSEALRR